MFTWRYINQYSISYEKKAGPMQIMSNSLTSIKIFVLLHTDVIANEELQLSVACKMCDIFHWICNVNNLLY